MTFTSKDTIEHVILPFITYFNKELHTFFEEELSNLRIEDEVIISLINDFSEKIIKFFSKPLIIEFNKIKINDPSIDLKKYFRKYLFDNSALFSFYSEYPVSARLSVTKMMYILRNIKSCFQHIDKDIKKLHKFFDFI